MKINYIPAMVEFAVPWGEISENKINAYDMLIRAILNYNS